MGKIYEARKTIAVMALVLVSWVSGLVSGLIAAAAF